ncbi:MAG: zinc-ribbon domain-containing protein [Methanobrevibacter sp.]|nr:zinc-ribbon domain-containing protein [Methanobrevibacter sp.]
MSKVDELQQKIDIEKRRILKERYGIEDELEQLKQDKFSYQRKGDFSALEKANIREKELKNKLEALKTRIPSLESQIKQAKLEENREKERLERQQKQKNQQLKTKKQMNEVLRLMRQGKTRSQAANTVGIPVYRISHWYREGKQGIGRDNSHFYRELRSIEEDSERRKREEINRRNRIRENEERKRRDRIEKQKNARENERLRSQKREARIKKQMDVIISQMKIGKTRKQAALYAGVPIKTVNEWFDKGFRRQGQLYINFYSKVNVIEINRRKQSKPVKPSKDNIVQKMDEFLSLMRKGLTRYEAAQKMNISPITANNWYNKGKNGDLTYLKFYNNVKSIEDAKNKYGTSNKPIVSYNYKSKSESNKNKTSVVNCPKCNKTYNKSLHSECPYCKKSQALANINYCSRCGKQLSPGAIYCSHCGKSVNDNKTKTSTSPINNDSWDWNKCCVSIIPIFIIFAFIGMFI